MRLCRHAIYEVVDELDSLLQELDVGYEHRLETFWKLNNAVF